MPLLLFTFGGSTGVYPVVFICSLLFNFIFWPITFFKAYKDSVKHTKTALSPKEATFSEASVPRLSGLVYLMA
jgi:hypothetical protein